MKLTYTLYFIVLQKKIIYLFTAMGKRKKMRLNINFKTSNIDYSKQTTLITQYLANAINPHLVHYFRCLDDEKIFWL